MLYNQHLCAWLNNNSENLSYEEENELLMKWFPSICKIGESNNGRIF